MKESILDVLLYLFEHLITDDADLGDPEARQSAALLAGLGEAGFSPSEVSKAFDWLDTLAERRPAMAAPRLHGPVRVFAGPELDKLEPDALGFLMMLEQHGVLDAEQRELVIDRAIALEQDVVDRDDLKWVVLMALCNQPGSEAAYAWMQTQVFEDDPEPVH